MNQDEYGMMVMQLTKSGEDTIAGLTPGKAVALHMALLVCGEAGELADAIKRWAIYGKEIDLDNVIEELGDLEFGLEKIRQIFLLTRAQCLTANNVKLAKKRYPKGYSDTAAQQRADKQEEILEVIKDIKAVKDSLNGITLRSEDREEKINLLPDKIAGLATAFIPSQSAETNSKTEHKASDVQEQYIFANGRYYSVIPEELENTIIRPGTHTTLYGRL